MFEYKHLADYARGRNELAGDYEAKAQETYESYLTDVQEIAAKARSDSRMLWETSSQSYWAATSGDDAIERSNTVWIQFQRKFAELNAEYFESCQESHEKLVESIGKLQADTSATALDDSLRFLDEVKSATTESGSGGGTKKASKGTPAAT